MSMTADETVAALRAMGRPTGENLSGMARYGISVERALCVSTPGIKKLARSIGKDHHLALQLWDTGWREARILAAMVGEPSRAGDGQMDCWVRDFDSWDVCDAVCLYLFRYTPLAFKKALEWSEREEEYVKRAGFALMACLAVGKGRLPDSQLEQFLPAIERQAGDGRNYVKKAVNWALRQVGKRDTRMNSLAIECAERIKMQGSKSARWIAADALRELKSVKVQARLKG